MTQAAAYIERLSCLQEGERSRLRRSAGQPLDATLQGFDLFTGLWWPLRAKSPATPRREPSWIVAKLYGSFPLQHRGGNCLPARLGRDCEPRAPSDNNTRDRFRSRFDALICSPLAALEPHLRWALSEVAKADTRRGPHAGDVSGIDWAQLLDDLSIWDRGKQHRRERDIRDLWAEAYLGSAT